jgi:hypothetical protein
MKSLFLILLTALFFMPLITDASFSAPERPDHTYSLPMLADAEFHPGRLVAVDGLGFAAEAADEAGLVVVGRIAQGAESFNLANGEGRVIYNPGVFSFLNDPTNPLTQEHHGRPCYVVDDITVGSDPGDNGIYAGLMRGLTPEGQVWVDTRAAALLQAS